jgi:hypothetical protein
MKFGAPIFQDVCNFKSVAPARAFVQHRNDEGLAQLIAGFEDWIGGKRSAPGDHIFDFDGQNQQSTRSNLPLENPIGKGY